MEYHQAKLHCPCHLDTTGPGGATRVTAGRRQHSGDIHMLHTRATGSWEAARTGGGRDGGWQVRAGVSGCGCGRRTGGQWVCYLAEGGVVVEVWADLRDERHDLCRGLLQLLSPGRLASRPPGGSDGRGGGCGR